MKKFLLIIAAFAIMTTTVSAQFLFDAKATKKEQEKTKQSAVTPTYKKKGQITQIRECCKKNEACCNPAQKCCDPIIVDAPQQAEPKQCDKNKANCPEQQNCTTPQNCPEQQNCTGEQNCTPEQNCNLPCCTNPVQQK